MFGRLVRVAGRWLGRSRIGSITMAVGCMLVYRTYNSQAIQHVHMNKKQYIDNVLDPTTNLDSEYFLIICDRGLSKQELDKFVGMAKTAAKRMGLETAIFSVEARDIDELDSVAQRVKKTGDKTEKSQEKRERRNPPSADLYFKSKVFDRLIQLDSFNPDTVEAKVSTIRGLIVDSADEPTIDRAVKLVKSQFDAPVIVRHVSTQQNYQQFKENVHELLSLGALPVGTKIFVTRQPVKLPGAEKIANDDTVIYRNSLYSVLHSKFGQANNEQPQSLSTFQPKQMSKLDSLSKFIFPEIFMIRASNYHDELTRLFKVFNFDRDRPTLSLRISSKETNQNKLRLLYELYNRYQQKLNFVVVTCGHVEELFGHTYQGCDELVMFNFFRSMDSQQQHTVGYLRPYQKSFLGNYLQDRSYSENMMLFCNEIDQLLQGTKPMKDYNVLKSERQQEINISKLKQLMKGDRPFLLRFCNKQCTIRPELIDADLDLYWLDTSVHNVQNLGDVLVDPRSQLLEAL